MVLVSNLRRILLVKNGNDKSISKTSNLQLRKFFKTSKYFKVDEINQAISEEVCTEWKCNAMLCLSSSFVREFKLHDRASRVRKGTPASLSSGLLMPTIP